MSRVPPSTAVRAKPWAEFRVAIRALPIAFLFAFSVQPSFASEHKSEPAPKGTIDGNQYFRLDPFVVPIMSREAVARHFTVVVTLELTDNNMREGVREKLPLLRHALNTALYQIIGIQRADGSLPPIATVKRRMVEVTHDVTGPDAVRDVLMESVYERKLR